MKYLRIDSGKGYFSLNEKDWHELDSINKGDLLHIVSSGLENGFEMDDPKVGLIQNKAHEIIYHKLHGKLLELNEQRTRFRDESESLYKEALEKYRTT